MTAPYYEDDRVTLYVGDCSEVTDWLSADVLVTDPPYGIRWAKPALAARPGGGASRAHEGILNDGDISARDIALSMWGHKPGIVFGSLKMPAPAELRQVLVWQKPSDAGFFGSTTAFRQDIEGVFLVGAWPKVAPRAGSVVKTAAPKIGGASGPSGKVGHPHAKLLDVMEALIDACPPGMIADPFAGSGSTLVAARNLGRRAIGVEIDERYCEVAARRLAQDVLEIYP
jgi:hypothetical protein